MTVAQCFHSLVRSLGTVMFRERAVTIDRRYDDNMTKNVISSFTRINRNFGLKRSFGDLARRIFGYAIVI